MPPSISVALCTRNGARFVEAQLLSILAQTNPPDQVVISDDASSDETVAIVRRVMDGTAPDLVLLENPVALGIAKNFEQAILATTGNLVALSDQDDYWRSDRLEVVGKAFERRPELLLLHHDARLIDEVGTFLGKTLFDVLGFSARERGHERDGTAFNALMRRNFVTGATVVFRRSLIARSVPFPSGWLHDEWLTVVAAAIGSIDFLTDQLIDYRQHGSNQIGVRSLSLAGKYGRMREPRTERNKRLLDLATALVPRLVDLGADVSADKLALAQQKLIHETVRSSLSPHVLHRIMPAVRELRSGRYSSCGRGIVDFARDVIQPV